MDLAYAPYSGLSVGAALLTEQGKVFVGANVENSCYGLSICAEKVAASIAITSGDCKWQALLVLFSHGVASAPCGGCRQFLAEFGSPEMLIAWGTKGGTTCVSKLGDLIPYPFNWSK